MLIGAKIKTQSKDQSFPDPLIISVVWIYSRASAGLSQFGHMTMLGPKGTVMWISQDNRKFSVAVPEFVQQIHSLQKNLLD